MAVAAVARDVLVLLRVVVVLLLLTALAATCTNANSQLRTSHQRPRPSTAGVVPVRTLPMTEPWPVATRGDR